jgi:hypothetical protein
MMMMDPASNSFVSIHLLFYYEIQGRVGPSSTEFPDSISFTYYVLPRCLKTGDPKMSKKFNML